MRNAGMARLRQGGWRVGTVREFLGLSRAEEALIELRNAPRL